MAQSRVNPNARNTQAPNNRPTQSNENNRNVSRGSAQAVPPVNTTRPVAQTVAPSNTAKRILKSKDEADLLAVIRALVHRIIQQPKNRLNQKMPHKEVLMRLHFKVPDR